MFHTVLSKKAEKNLRKLDNIYKSKIRQTIDLLEKNPFLGKKMQGNFVGYYRVKIPPLRIIYSINFKDHIIWIIAIGHRGNIYK